MTRMATTARPAPINCITMNIGMEPGSMPANVLLRVRVTDTAGVGERGRRREPIGTADVGGDRSGRECISTGAHEREDQEDEAEGCNDLAEVLARTITYLLAHIDGIELEHEVRSHDADRSTADLGGNVRQDVSPGTLSECRIAERDSRIEVSARNRPKHQDDGVEDANGGTGIGQQLQSDVVGEALGHDAGSNHPGKQKGSADELGEKAAIQGRDPNDEVRPGAWARPAIAVGRALVSLEGDREPSSRARCLTALHPCNTEPKATLVQGTRSFPITT